MGWLDDVSHSMDMGFSKLREIVMDQEAWCVANSQIQLSD